MNTRIPKSSMLGLLLLAFISTESKAEPTFNFHASVGLGLRYSVFTFPFPHLNLNAKLGRGVVFAEGSASPAFFAASVGYDYQLTKKSSLYLAKTEGFYLGGELSGYKVGYTYNSNAFNKRGWLTSVELYRVIKTLNPSNSLDVEVRPPSTKLVPSISFAYQW